MTRSTTVFTTIDSPVGPLLLAAADDGLRAIEFHASRHPVPRDPDWREGDHPLLQRTREQLGEYFAGERLPGLALEVGAARCQRPKAMRAVGSANGRNPLPIVLPCHRVIGADGSLTGFGGGLPTKQYLLELEGALPRARVGVQAEPSASNARTAVR